MNKYPRIEKEAATGTWILRLDGGSNWQVLSNKQARRLMRSMSENLIKPSKHILKITIG